MRIFIVFVALIVIVRPSFSQGVDLHNHLLMEDGFWVLRGSSGNSTKAKSAHSRLDSKSSFAALENSQLGIVVVALYAHPVLSALRLSTVKQSIERQILKLEKFVEDNPEWIIAKTPEEAKKARDSGKKVFVLSLETSRGTLDQEADFQKFIDEKGIAIVTPLHLSHDDLGGVALIRGMGILNAPLTWLSSWIQGHKDETGIYTNEKGLSAEGLKHLKSLIKRRVWIDLAHASDQSLKAMIPILKGAPLLMTHGMPRSAAGMERGFSKETLKWFSETKGIIGLIPSDDFMQGVSCRGLAGFKKIWKELENSAHLLLGSDFNAPLRGLAEQNSENCQSQSFYRMDDVPTLYKELGVQNLAKQEAVFIESWTKARALTL